MTNEEIQRRFDELSPTLPTGQTMFVEDHEELERLILDFARSLVSQAYEEAERTAMNIAGQYNRVRYESPEGDPARAVGCEQGALRTAAAIRDLKDSLVESPVASP